MSGVRLCGKCPYKPEDIGEYYSAFGTELLCFGCQPKPPVTIQVRRPHNGGNGQLRLKFGGCNAQNPSTNIPSVPSTAGVTR